MYGANNVDSVFRFLKEERKFLLCGFHQFTQRSRKKLTTTTTTTEKFFYLFLVVEVEVVHTTTTEIVSRKNKKRHTHTHMAISLFNATLPTWLMNYYPDTGKRLKKSFALVM